MPDTAASATQGVPSASDGVEKLSEKELIPVYWMQSSNEGVYLYREFAHSKASGDPVTDAISYLLNAKPAQDGWFTYLKPTDDIGVSIGADNVITVDLPQKVFSAKLDEGLAQRSIQQLVFTSTAAAANAGLLAEGQTPRMRLLVDGMPHATVFDGYHLDGEYQRDASFVAPIWIIDPQSESAFAPGKLVLNGRSVQFSGGTYYRLERATQSRDWSPVGQPVRIAADQLAEDGSFSSQLHLASGEYRLTLWGQNTGSEAKIARVSSTFTVR